MPVDTFVVLMMENRSFDHYLGWLPGADGRQSGLTYTDAGGLTHQTLRLAPDFQGCAHPDPDHSWDGGRIQVNNGAMDGFLRSGDNDEFSIGYYAPEDLGFISHAARAFTTYDRFFCSLLASTYPNREYMHAAQSYGKKDNSFPSGSGFPDTTIFAALSAKGISNRYFFSDLPVAALWGSPGLARSGRVDEYYTRAAAGTLPALSFVDPAFAGEDQGASNDDHPHADIMRGQAFLSRVAAAITAGPAWARTALVITYDEWGGFFDHVPPPLMPDSHDPGVGPTHRRAGFRVPTFVLSPFARRGLTTHEVYDHTSILTMVEWRWGLSPLTKRDAAARNLAYTFDFAQPDTSVPSLPLVPDTVPTICGTPGSGTAAPALSREAGEWDELRDALMHTGWRHLL